MDDLISRQAAIAKFEPWLKVDGYSEGELNMLKAVLYELRSLPSAQPDWLPDMLFVDTKTGEVLGKIHRGEGLEPLQKKAHSTDKED